MNNQNVRKPPAPVGEEEVDPADLYNIDDEDEAVDNPMVVERYKQSSFIARKALEMIIQKCTPGVTVVSLCEFGDQAILKLCEDNVKDGSKFGVAIPTSVSPGTFVCNYSPSVLDEKDVRKIYPGEEVRIDLGVHVDGYISQVGTTVFQALPPHPNRRKVTDMDRTRTLCAAKRIMDLTMRMMKPGMGNYEVGLMTRKLCTYYGVEFLRGVLSHEISRYVLRGPKVILHRPTEDVQVFNDKFKMHEVYVLDIAVSSNLKNLGRTREKDARPNLYRREVSQFKQFLKNESATRVLEYLDENFDNFYFPMRRIYENKGQIGFVELKQKGLVSGLPVLHGRANECIVRLIATVAITDDRIVPFCVPTMQESYLKDQLNLQDQRMISILRTNLSFDDRFDHGDNNNNNVMVNQNMNNSVVSVPPNMNQQKSSVMDTKDE